MEFAIRVMGETSWSEESEKTVDDVPGVVDQRYEWHFVEGAARMRESQRDDVSGSD
jgi:hypothetical protein